MSREKKLERTIEEKLTWFSENRPQFRRAFYAADYSDFYHNLYRAGHYIAGILLYATKGNTTLAKWIFKECPLSKKISPEKLFFHETHVHDEWRHAA